MVSLLQNEINTLYNRWLPQNTSITDIKRALKLWLEQELNSGKKS